jgi:hypothetical protein
LHHLLAITRHLGSCETLFLFFCDSISWRRNVQPIGLREFSEDEYRKFVQTLTDRGDLNQLACSFPPEDCMLPSTTNVRFWRLHTTIGNWPGLCASRCNSADIGSILTGGTTEICFCLVHSSGLPKVIVPLFSGCQRERASGSPQE